jgi:hypothetical protein
MKNNLTFLALSVFNSPMHTVCNNDIQESLSIPRIRKDVLAISAALAAIVFAAITLIGRNSANGLIFFLLAFMLLAAHWFILTFFIAAVFSSQKAIVALLGLLVLFPLMLAGSLVVIAGKISHKLLFPVALGILVVPGSIMFYSLYRGLKGQFSASSPRRKDEWQTQKSKQQA